MCACVAPQNVSIMVITCTPIYVLALFKEMFWSVVMGILFSEAYDSVVTSF